MKYSIPSVAVGTQARTLVLAGALVAGFSAAASAQTNDPIKIGVIAEVQSIAGAATPGGAQIAAGLLGRIEA